MQKRKRVQVISFQSLTANSGAGMARIGHMLSSELKKRNMLVNFIVHSKGKFQTPFISLPVSFFSRYYLFLLNKFNNLRPIPSYKFRLLQEILFDWFCQWRIKKETNILFTTNAFLKRTFKKAKKLGIIIVLLPGTPEENYISSLVLEENKTMGVTSTDPYTYKKRLQYYNQSKVLIDKVVCSLPTVYNSYVQSDFQGEVVKILGHMTPDFNQSNIVLPKVSSDVYTVGYLAHTVVLKGLQYLLSAWKDITEQNGNSKLRLLVAGNLDHTMKSYVDKHFSGLKNVKMVGHVTDVPSFMLSLDLFVIPSLVDGGPITALEATQFEVPVLITENSGSCELLSRIENGCMIVPIKDKDALKEKILWAFSHPDESKQMGINAKNNLETYSMPNFISEIGDYLEYKI